MFCICFVFFFKQKTAYEMRISDWSSDVCSSDLAQPFPHIVVDGFWSDTDLELCEMEFPSPADSLWRTYPDPKEYGKRAMDDDSQWGRGVGQFMAQIGRAQV